MDFEDDNCDLEPSDDWEIVQVRTYGKEIWKMLWTPLYLDTEQLVHNICNVKWELLLDQLYNENNERDDNFSVFQDYVGSEKYDVIKTLIHVNNDVTPIITTYVELLLTYNKYNKLNVLKNKTKLNNDIIFDIIIKYL